MEERRGQIHCLARRLSRIINHSNTYKYEMYPSVLRDSVCARLFTPLLSWDTETFRLIADSLLLLFITAHEEDLESPRLITRAPSEITTLYDRCSLNSCFRSITLNQEQQTDPPTSNTLCDHKCSAETFIFFYNIHGRMMKWLYCRKGETYERTKTSAE